MNIIAGLANRPSHNPSLLGKTRFPNGGWTDERGVSLIQTGVFVLAFVVAGSLAFTIYSVVEGGVKFGKQTSEVVAGGIDFELEPLIVRDATALANNSLDAIETLRLAVSISAQTDSSVELSDSNTVIAYSDSEQKVDLPGSAWSIEWPAGKSGDFLEPGQQTVINVDVTGLATPLMARREFTVLIETGEKIVLTLTAEVPPELKRVIRLQ